MKGLYERVEGLKYKIEITPAAKDLIADKGFDPQFGARPLKRAIQKYLEDEMAEVIIGNTIGEGDTIKLDLDETGENIVAAIIPKSPSPSEEESNKKDIDGE